MEKLARSDHEGFDPIPERLTQCVDQLESVGEDGIATTLVQVVEGRAETQDRRRVRRPGLHCGGPFGRLGVERHGGAGATEAGRAEFDPVTDSEETQARRCEQTLVRGRDQGIGTEIEVEQTGGLARVDETRRAVREKRVCTSGDRW